jgi:hypothetical protein
LTLSKFTSAYLVLLGILIISVIGLKAIFPSQNIFIESFWGMFIFFAGITYIAYIVAYIGIKRNPEAGVLSILGAITLKMLFCFALVLIYRLKEMEMGLVFLLNFFSLYLLFTTFEIYCLLRNLRHQN